MAVGDAHVFPGLLTPVLTQLSFQSHRLLFSHVSADARGENKKETRFQTHNHQVMCPTHSPEPLRQSRQNGFYESTTI